MLLKKRICSSVILGILACSITTLAQASGPGFYVGGQLGYVHTNFKDTDNSNGISSSNVDNNGIGWGGLVGYQFNSYFALEAGYLGADGMKISDPNGLPIDENLDMRAVDLLVKGILPINDRVNIYGKVGAASVRATTSYDIRWMTIDTPALVTSQTTETKPVIGVGVSWDITPHLPLDISWLHIAKAGGDIPSADFVLVGLGYHFG
jgi:OmpA-OmpF porin, OOP family